MRWILASFSSADVGGRSISGCECEGLRLPWVVRPAWIKQGTVCVQVRCGWSLAFPKDGGVYGFLGYGSYGGECPNMRPPSPVTPPRYEGTALAHVYPRDVVKTDT